MNNQTINKMDININPDGISLGFGYELIIYFLIMAIPIGLIWWRILKKKVMPASSRIIYIATATVLTTVILYIILVLLCLLYLKISYLA
ncbi:hypothetical protein D0T84_04740 [Dysgonomonas sp. 521]|nr:hypothetical protein [Dysgonomonas sp. 521]